MLLQSMALLYLYQQIANKSDDRWQSANGGIKTADVIFDVQYSL